MLDNSSRTIPSYNPNGGFGFENNLPQQTVSWKEKMGDGEEPTDWQKKCMGFFAGTFMSGSMRRSQKKVNYDLVNGIFDFKDYKTTLRAVYSEEEYGEIPVEMKHYPICTLPLKELWGTEPMRPFNWRAKDQSEGATNEYIRAKSDMLQQYMMSKISEEFKRKGIDISTPEGQAMIPKDIEGYFKRKYNTANEIAANKILRKLITELNMKEKFQLGWKDATICAEEWYWVGTLNNDIVCEVVNPMNLVFDKSYDLKYLDEAEFVVRGEYLAPSNIIDRYKQDLSPEDAEDIEHMAWHNGVSSRRPGARVTGIESIFTGNSLANDVFSNYYPVDAQSGYPLDPNFATFGGNQGYTDYDNMSGFTNKSRHLLVLTPEWMSKRKVAKVQYIDDEGMPQTMLLDGEFQLDKKMKAAGWEVKYFWINEAWQGVQIGRDIIINVKPKENQHTSFSSLGKARLGYTGTIYNNRNSLPVSILDTMKQHQMMYNVLYRKWEEAINSDMGQIFVANLNQIPSKGDWTLDKWLWMLRELKIAVIDTTNDKTNTSFQGINLSQLNYMTQLVEQLTYLRNECWLMAGFSPQRLAVSNPTETATASNAALNQSYAQTAYDYRIHDDVKTRVLNLLVNEAKVVYKKNKTLTYFLDDMSRDVIEITEDFAWSELCVFITDSAQDQKILEALRSPQMIQAALQNGAGLVDVSTMLSTDSIAELNEKLQKIKDADEAQKQQAYQIEQEKIKQIASEGQANRDFTASEAQLDRENEILVAQIKAVGNDSMSTDTPDTAVIDNTAELALEASRLNYDVVAKQRELNTKDKDINTKRELEHRKLDIEEKRMKLENKQFTIEQNQQNAKNKVDKKLAEEKLRIEKIKARKPTSKK